MHRLRREGEVCMHRCRRRKQGRSAPLRPCQERAQAREGSPLVRLLSLLRAHLPLHLLPTRPRLCALVHIGFVFFLVSVDEGILASTIWATTRTACTHPAPPRCGGEDAGYGETRMGMGSGLLRSALMEAYPHDGDEEATPTSDARMHATWREAYPHEQQPQVAPRGRSPFRLVPRPPAFYALLVRLDFFPVRTHQRTF
ncbi:hypothetical protein DFH08DRAFT_887761 [Mycena albidolilacea]|uniref:Uncharacterized protein n=1 Tax=Mycena albidolilacea TaxID=1033008 RepID=A0AAD6ZI39_9AGAR|nr:hypothetical protein DFH08DRAFT_887761 [Mycena albidolilacea]